MLRIGILEDEEAYLLQLTEALERYHGEHPEFVYSLNTFRYAYQLTETYTPEYDLLFIDIRLPDMLGTEAAKKIREMDGDVMIVFTTNYTQYALEGYTVNAFDYILKPLRYPTFSVKLARILRMLNHRAPKSKWIILRTRNESVPVSADQITYIEVSGHDLLVHTESRTVEVWGSLKKMEGELEGAYFARCNSCYLVNLKHVTSVRGFSVMVGKEELAVSKAKKKEFMAALAQFRGGTV